MGGRHSADTPNSVENITSLAKLTYTQCNAADINLLSLEITLTSLVVLCVTDWSMNKGNRVGPHD